MTRQPGAAMARDLDGPFSPAEVLRILSARYSVVREDAEGTTTLMVTNDRAEAEALLGALQYRPAEGRTYSVIDREAGR